MKKQFFALLTIILLIPTICYPALNRVYDATGGVITDGAMVEAYKWNNEWANIYNHPNEYLEGIIVNNATIAALTSTTVLGNLRGAVTATGIITGNVASSVITGATFDNVVTNLKYKIVTFTDSPFQVTNGDNLLIDTTGGAITLLLPSDPSVGSVFSFTDSRDYFSTYSLTINPNGKLFRGLTSNQIFNGTNQYPSNETSGYAITFIESYSLVYGSVTSGWVYYGYGYDN